ncbi:hypothetical protein CEXT_718121 [Caerostris extrusa]|uniref:Uncharacterized protein n=1 Tax=Caerostris extrusa TaxID=172846 RepID=A0AAV4QGV5_CAEEX|nr:hypothetical protein CEXT_718121 [Caerostris extrusa]
MWMDANSWKISFYGAGDNVVEGDGYRKGQLIDVEIEVQQEEPNCLTTHAIPMEMLLIEYLAAWWPIGSVLIIG